jgi:uncharacterized protein YwgA
MAPLQRNAILLRLVREMRQKGSWCGETHVQKAVYLLQDMAGAETEFDFVLYKHGPFSFELRDEITMLRADNLLELRVQAQPYGPKLIPTDQAQRIEEKFPQTLQKNSERIMFTAKTVGDKGVSELERLATALFITKREMRDASADDRASRLNEIKPHISPFEARQAVREIDDLLAEAASEGLVT